MKSRSMQSRLARRVLFVPALIVLLLTACSSERDSGGAEKASSNEPAQQTSEMKASLAGPNSPVKGVHHMQMADIVDRQGFGRPITAARVLIPTGWKAEGGIVWQVHNHQGCGPNPTRFEWRASSPDGMTVAEILPEETWAGNNLGMGATGACPNVWLRSAREYLHAYVQKNRSTARVRSYRDRPDIAKQFQHLNQNIPGPAGETRIWVEAGEVMLDYNLNGQAMEEVIALLVTFNHMRMQGVYPGEIREFLTMSTLPGFAMRAPRGSLNLKLAEAIRTSGKANPEWTQLMNQHNMKIAAINRKGAMDRHRITMETNREIAEMNRKSYEYRQKVQDEGHRKFSQVIRGVETYNEPDTNTQVELPYTHDHAWKLNDDTYILTDDPNFEPYRDLGVEGNQLQRAD